MNKDKISEEIKAFLKEAKEDILHKLGDNIRDFREAMDSSQEDLAESIHEGNIISKFYDLCHSENDRVILDINFSSKVLSRYERGEVGMGIIPFINICIGLKKTPNDLLKDFLPYIDFEQPEILELYEKLNDENKKCVIQYLDFLVSKQDKEKTSTLK